MALKGKSKLLPPQRPYVPVYLPQVPREYWQTLAARRKVDSVRLGRRLTRGEIVIDLIRQYAEAVTYFGKRAVPNLIPPPPDQEDTGH
jgi:hypothetical protein